MHNHGHESIHGYKTDECCIVIFDCCRPDKTVAVDKRQMFSKENNVIFLQRKQSCKTISELKAKSLLSVEQVDALF